MSPGFSLPYQHPGNVPGVLCAPPLTGAARNTNAFVCGCYTLPFLGSCLRFRGPLLRRLYLKAPQCPNKNQCHLPLDPVGPEAWLRGSSVGCQCSLTPRRCCYAPTFLYFAGQECRPPFSVNAHLDAKGVPDLEKASRDLGIKPNPRDHCETLF